MKKLKLMLFSMFMGLLLGRYYSIFTGKLLLEYIRTAYLSFKFSNFANNKADIITAEEKLQ
jgi:hypothetical protein